MDGFRKCLVEDSQRITKYTPWRLASLNDRRHRHDYMSGDGDDEGGGDLGQKHVLDNDIETKQGHDHGKPNHYYNADDHAHGHDGECARPGPWQRTWERIWSRKQP